MHVIFEHLVPLVEALKPARVQLVGGAVRRALGAALEGHFAAPSATRAELHPPKWETHGAEMAPSAAVVPPPTPLPPGVERDLAIDLPVDAVVARLQRAGWTVDDAGRAFGSVRVRVDGLDLPVEITSLRTERYVAGSRFPQVAFTDDWRQDAARRDFTCNAVYVDGEGSVFDPYHGCDDIEARRVVWIGDPLVRAQDDPLRVLRWARFGCALGDDLTTLWWRDTDTPAPVQRMDVGEWARAVGPLTALRGRKVGAEWAKLTAADVTGHARAVLLALWPMLGDIERRPTKEMPT